MQPKKYLHVFEFLFLTLAKLHVFSAPSFNWLSTSAVKAQAQQYKTGEVPDITHIFLLNKLKYTGCYTFYHIYVKGMVVVEQLSVHFASMQEEIGRITFLLDCRLELVEWKYERFVIFSCTILTLFILSPL